MSWPEYHKRWDIENKEKDKHLKQIKAELFGPPTDRTRLREAGRKLRIALAAKKDDHAKP